jgi:hypothetical protein
LAGGSNPSGPTNNPLSEFIASNTLNNEELERFKIPTLGGVVQTALKQQILNPHSLLRLSNTPSVCDVHQLQFGEANE